MSLFYPYVVISPPYVTFGEYFCFSQTIDYIGNKREGIAVFDSVFIEPSVILNKTKFSIFLLYEEDRRGKQGFGGLNVSFSQVVLEEFVELFLFV